MDITFQFCKMKTCWRLVTQEHFIHLKMGKRLNFMLCVFATTGRFLKKERNDGQELNSEV